MSWYYILWFDKFFLKRINQLSRKWRSIYKIWVFFHFLLPLFSIEQINPTANCQIKGGNTRNLYESSTDPWNECVVTTPSYFSAFWTFWTLKGCVTHFWPKIAALPGPTEKWNCKSWENARTVHNERFNFYLIWFKNESNIFQITGTRPQYYYSQCMHLELHTSLLALCWPEKIKIWRHKTKNI